MATENFTLSASSRQNVLSTAVRFSGADVGADFAATEVKIELPPNAILLRGGLLVLTAEGGTSPTFSVGVSGTENKYGNNLAVGTTGEKALTGVPAKETTGITLAVTQGTGSGFDGAADVVLHLEYIVEGRGNEIFG